MQGTIAQPVRESVAFRWPFVRGAWIVSPRFDLALVLIPMLATALAVLLPADDGPPPMWVYIGVVVAFDVAHVWSTLYISYLDGEAFRRRRALFLLPIPIALLVSWRLHSISPELFWTVVAYFAIHHFIAQHWGFVALYRYRAGEKGALDRRLDKAAVWTGALGPLLLWHASPDRQLAWFGNGEVFLVRLDPALRADILLVMAVVGAAWITRQVWQAGRGKLNAGKALWMVGSWLSWSIGLLASHPIVALAAVNLMHGLPFLGLVWFRCNRRWQGRRASGATGVLAWLSQRRAWAVFWGALVLVALVEETIWDGAVWGKYVPALTGWETLDVSGVWGSLLVALLATPQLVHYTLDRFLWKMDGSNPDLREALEMDVPLPERATPA